jgi:CheY-like chemotaxis protein
MLITDDDAAFRSTLQSVFAPVGFHTFLASCGWEAMETARRHFINILIMDMNMPDLTGLETFHLIKQIRENVPCVFVSAEPDSFLSLRRTLEPSELYSHIEKPVDLKMLRRVVRELLLQGYNRPT